MRFELHPLQGVILPRNSCAFDTSSAVHLHSSPERVPDLLFEAFSLSVHHSSLTAFAVQGGLVTPPEQRYRYASMTSTLIVVSSSLQLVKELSLTSRHNQKFRRA